MEWLTLLIAAFAFFQMLLIVGYFLLKKLRRIYRLRMVRRLAQGKAVNARYFNKHCEAIWDDLMSFDVGGWFEIDRLTIEDVLQQLMPETYEVMKDTKAKNKEAWLESLAKLLPIILSLKGYLHYKPQKILNQFFSGLSGESNESTNSVNESNLGYVLPVEKDKD